MIITIIILSGTLTVLHGRLMFGRWYNHVGLYGFSWSFSLALFHIGLIGYYPIEFETWLVIVAGWISFVLGSSIVVASQYSIRHPIDSQINYHSSLPLADPSAILRILWGINCLTILGSIYDIYNVSRLLGGVFNIFTLGNLLYNIRVHEGIPGAIPYLGTLTFLGSLLAGFYTSRIGSMRAVALIAILTSLINSITNMSRAALIVSGILFVTGYFVCRKAEINVNQSQSKLNFTRVAGLLIVLMLIIGSMELIRGNRGMTEGFAGESKSLSKLSVGAGSFITPSIFMYITVHHGVLNQYLKKNSENLGFAHYSMAPLSRAISKFGFDTYVEQHPRFYLTPTPANTGTYLRELHNDYGMYGVVFIPFILGLVSSIFWFRVKRNQQILDVIVLGHIYVIVGMSLFTFATGMGVWWSSLSLGILIVLAFLPHNREIDKNKTLY